MTKALPLFNGVSISKIEIEQDGDLHVEFDLPTEKHSLNFRTDIIGKRSFDLYQDKALRKVAGQLFRLIKERLEAPDASRVGIACMKCHESRCCREYTIPVTDDDIAELARHLGKTADEVRKENLTALEDWTNEFRFELAKDKDDQGEKCAFLKRDDSTGTMRCSVYAARPILCRDFQEEDCVLFDDQGRRL